MRVLDLELLEGRPMPLACDPQPRHTVGAQPKERRHMLGGQLQADAQRSPTQSSRMLAWDSRTLRGKRQGLGGGCSSHMHGPPQPTVPSPWRGPVVGRRHGSQTTALEGEVVPPQARGQAAQDAAQALLDSARAFCLLGEAA